MTRSNILLRVLIVGSSDREELLILRSLRRWGYEPVHERVDTPEAMERSLAGADERGEPWDVVISDLETPGLRAWDALALLGRLGYGAPLIVVSDEAQEETAVALMLIGARDHVAKENMIRLGPAIERELRGAYSRRSRARLRSDASEEQKAVDALAESQESFGATFEQAAVGIAHVRPDGKWLRINRRLCEIVGYTHEELRGMDRQDIIHPDDVDMEATKWPLFDDTETYSVEKRYLGKGGSVVWVNTTVSPVLAPSGKPKYFIEVVEDITGRKRTEEALRQSEALYRAVVEQATASIILADARTERILEANAALGRLLGYSAEELSRMTLHDIVARERKGAENGALLEADLLVGEQRYLRKDGSTVDVEASASTVSYDGGDVLCIVAHDVTARNEAAEDLRRSLGTLLALREAGQVLGSTLDFEEIGSRLLGIMKNVSNLTTALVCLADEQGNLRVSRSVGLEGLWPRARFAPEAGEARRAALERGEYGLFVLERPDAPSERLTGLCLPLRMHDDRVIGVLEAYGRESVAESDTIEILRSLTNQAASAQENALLYEELAERERRLQDLVARLLRAQEEERRRVAYEVHDELAQVAVAAHQHLQAYARRHPPATESSRQDLDLVLKLVRRTVTDARRIIANLRPTALDDLGLASAVALEVERLRQENYRVEYVENLGDERVPAPVEIALFRALQEALTNVRKHAGTGWVRVELRRSGDEVSVEVEDDGRGFDPAASYPGQGPGERVGHAGMRERVSALGGRLEIRSSPGIGATITATVPLARSQGNSSAEEVRKEFA